MPMLVINITLTSVEFEFLTRLCLARLTDKSGIARNLPKFGYVFCLLQNDACVVLSQYADRLALIKNVRGLDHYDMRRHLSQLSA